MFEYKLIVHSGMNQIEGHYYTIEELKCPILILQGSGIGNDLK